MLQPELEPVWMSALDPPSLPIKPGYLTLFQPKEYPEADIIYYVPIEHLGCAPLPYSEFAFVCSFCEGPYIAQIPARVFQITFRANPWMPMCSACFEQGTSNGH